MPSEKRARQKEGRELREAMYRAQLRRRRMIRLTAVLVVVVVLVVAGIVAGNAQHDNSKKSAAPKPTPSPSATGVACGAEAPPPANPKQYKKPQQVTKPGVTYTAVIKTSCGEIDATLDSRLAPKTVNSFVFLAQEGFFNGLTWHRIVRDFVIQAGDPDGINGDQLDGPGYTIPDETSSIKPNDYVYGVLAMANAGPNTGGSQFFIVVHKSPDGGTNEPAGLQPNYTIFGKVSKSSYPVLDKIAAIPTFGGNGPNQDSPTINVYIDSITIKES
ncbi:MAG: peptidylprolyl isomerase [Actinomycetota bacterium]|nr:peptidylprolyl isomerase [Actinomycetota bacterium]